MTRPSNNTSHTRTQARVFNLCHFNTIMSNFFTTDDDDDATLHPSSQSTRSTRHRQSNPIATLLDDAHRHPDQQSPLPTKNGTHKVSSAPPIIELQTAWVNERAAPQLLAWKGDAVDSVCSQIEEQMVSLSMPFGLLLTPS